MNNEKTTTSFESPLRHNKHNLQVGDFSCHERYSGFVSSIDSAQQACQTCWLPFSGLLVQLSWCVRWVDPFSLLDKKGVSYSASRPDVAIDDLTLRATSAWRCNSSDRSKLCPSYAVWWRAERYPLSLCSWCSYTAIRIILVTLAVALRTV